MQPRMEYPRPQFKRENYTNLNGQWSFAYDDKDLGLKEKWYLNKEFNKTIIVPYVHQSKASGIHDTSNHDILWYERTFDVQDLSKRTILHFGAVDYEARVYVNGEFVGEHEGGHSPFSFDITSYVKTQNKVTVRVRDYSKALDLPRGKQYWKDQSEGIYYTKSTGIWQSVWYEQVPESYIKHVYYTTRFDEKIIELSFDTVGHVSTEIKISINGQTIITDNTVLRDQSKKAYVLCENEMAHASKKADWHNWEWSPENPQLIDVTFTCEEETIESYFAFRKVSSHNGQFFLNNLPYYQKLVLDQGYWPEGLLTAPTDEDFIKDIEYTKAMGFNGVRKHQKSEDPRFLYHADKMGLLVWAEAANSVLFTQRGSERFTREWIELIKRDYNHPSIVAWVPINESWGVDNITNCKDQQSFATAMYHLTKSFDQTRMVISNDGWIHTISDLFTIHDYQSDKEILKATYANRDEIQYKTPAKRLLYAPGHQYNGEPIIISEFGGISYQKDETEGWGYSNAVSDDDFLARYEAVITALYESPNIHGYCYTQIVDVEQEINGLMTYDRKPKVPLASIKAINDKRKSN